MSLEVLQKLFSPPSTPVDSGSKEDWQRTEKKLKVSFPESYFELAQCYGSGSFEVNEGGFSLYLTTPFSDRYGEYWETIRHRLDGDKIGEGDEYVPYKVFPKAPGLLIWADDLHSSEYYWLASKKTKNWPIIARSHDNEYVQYNLSLTDFLVQFFSGRLQSPFWPKRFFGDDPTFEFKPYKLPPPIEYPKLSTLYQLYANNGNRAGFWYQRFNGHANSFYFLRTIAGKDSAPVNESPGEDGRHFGTADIYAGNDLIESDSPIYGVEVCQYFLVDPPKALGKT